MVADLDALTTEDLLRLQRAALTLELRAAIQAVLLRRRDNARRAERGLPPRTDRPAGGR